MRSLLHAAERKDHVQQDTAAQCPRHTNDILPLSFTSGGVLGAREDGIRDGVLGVKRGKTRGRCGGGNGDHGSSARVLDDGRSGVCRRGNVRLLGKEVLKNSA